MQTPDGVEVTIKDDDPEDKLITALTYNIHSCVGSDWKYDCARVAQNIQAALPDVVGIQEVRRGNENIKGATRMEMVKVSYIHASSAVRCKLGSSEDKDLELYTHR